MAEDQAEESSVNAVRRDHHGGWGADRRGGHQGSMRDGAEAEHRASPGDAAAAADGICYLPLEGRRRGPLLQGQCSEALQLAG
jgi:hypothetical protein